MLNLLIDDAGAVWPTDRSTLRRRFGRIRLRGDFLSEAIRLGLIFASFDGSNAKIALRPYLITRKAISRLAMVCAHGKFQRVALSVDGKMSSWQIFRTSWDTIARIDALVSKAQEQAPRPLLSATVLALDTVNAAGPSTLSCLMQAWTENAARSVDELYGILGRTRLLERSIIFRKDYRSEQFIIDHWGNKRGVYGPEWPRIAVGRDLMDQPNSTLRTWNFEASSRVAAQGHPQLLACDFVAKNIDNRLSRRTFRRLLLPWETSDRQIFVSNIDFARRTQFIE